MEQVYGNKWVRPVGDLDILISRKDYPLVRDHLLNNGFVFSDSEIFRGSGQEYIEVCESFSNEMSFVNKRKISLSTLTSTGMWQGCGKVRG
jgi:hypothetical protein